MVKISNTSTMASRTPQGILCILTGMVLFAGQDALMKLLIGHYTVWQLIGVRAAITAAILIPVILILGGEHRLMTPYWRLYVLRGALFAAGFSMFYAGFPYMTFANLVTIFFAAPLITAVLAVFFLGESIGIHRKVALAVGFLGVTISMRPGGDSFQWVSLLPLFCALSYAISQIAVRRIGSRDSTLTIGLYTIVCAGAFVVPISWALNALIDLGEHAPHLAFRWFIPTIDALPMLIALGTVGMAAYILVSRAYQVGDASAIAPFEYIYVPIAAALGYFAWGEVPVWNTLVGMVLIIVSGIYIGHREMADARRAKTPAPTAETPFVPGHPPPPPPVYKS
ncbi:MAG: DMT family transporter [Kiloniellales bacterium]|nr:DMT family transporter [Kiloniellales bacterium]